MTGSSTDRHIVAAQLGRTPREPWRVSSRCRFGYPTAIVSPSVLADSTPFPTLVWLTCPWLAEKVSALESSGEIARWNDALANDGSLSRRLSAAEGALRRARATESGGFDACSQVGIAGQRETGKVKCVHAHVALALIGIDDPVGRAVIDEAGTACRDERCAGLCAHIAADGSE